MTPVQLSLEIIRSYGMQERTYKPDWDDTSIEFTLPNGIRLSAMTQCCNSPCNSDSLEGMDGYVYITTQQELEQLMNMTYEQALHHIKEQHEDFNIEDYL